MVQKREREQREKKNCSRAVVLLRHYHSGPVQKGLVLCGLCQGQLYWVKGDLFNPYPANMENSVSS